MITTILVDGLAGLQRFFDAAPEVARVSVRIALNYGADFGVAKLLPAELRKEVAFPAGYIEAGRLTVETRATNDSLEAVVGGREEPTSLARFAGAATLGQRGATVTVKPGHPIALKRAFLVKLKRGRQSIAGGFNVGLAVRLRPGDTLRGSTAAVQLEDNVFLLYGPSVAQVLRNAADSQTDTIADAIRAEFFRQFERLTGDAARA